MESETSSGSYLFWIDNLVVAVAKVSDQLLVLLEVLEQPLSHQPLINLRGRGKLVQDVVILIEP